MNCHITSKGQAVYGQAKLLDVSTDTKQRLQISACKLDLWSLTKVNETTMQSTLFHILWTTFILMVILSHLWCFYGKFSLGVTETFHDDNQKG